MTNIRPMEPGRLKRDVLGLQHIIASTLANIAPAMSFFFGFGVIVAGAGVGAPLTIVVAMVAVLFLANTLSEFSRYTPSTGSFVTFMGKAFGPTTAACVSVFLVFGYIVAASSVVSIAGGWTQTTILKYFGINIPWQIISLLACLLVGTMVGRGVGMSTRWAAIFFYFELALLLIGAVLLLAYNPKFITLAPFKPASLSGGLAGIGAGFPLAIYLFIGWENSAMLAEETTNPRRNVPRALFTATIAIGVVYLFLAYATEVGFHDNGAAIAKADIPFIDALGAALGGAIVLAYIAGLSSIFSSLIGLTNSQARILFSSGREGLLPTFVGKLHPRHQTPARAMWTFLAIALALVYVFGWAEKPLDYFGQASTLGTIPVILVYMATNLALPVYMRRYHPEQMKPLRHLVVPVLGTIFMLFPLWGLVQPGQDYPFNLFPWIALVVLAVSIIYGVFLARRTPELMARIGSLVADE